MDRFKIENFERENGVGTFPAFRSLTQHEADCILTAMKRRLGLSNDADSEDVLQAIDRKSTYIDGIDTTKDDFDLANLLTTLHYSAQTVLINRWRFDKMDEFESAELCKAFHYVFYPSADDVEIMNSELTWLLSIRHYGAAKALRFS